MKVIKDDIWNYYKKGWIVITTNGFVKKNGECVMGRGIAKQARDKFPGFADKLGKQIKCYGNKVYCWMDEQIITFPTKHNWWETSDIKLIEESAKRLAETINIFDTLPKVYMPKPGCSNGRLKWVDVEPVIDKHLKHLVTIVDWSK
jgi:hypothetical protein